MPERAHQRRQTGDVAHGHAAAADALQAVVRADQRGPSRAHTACASASIAPAAIPQIEATRAGWKARDALAEFIETERMAPRRSHGR